MDPSQYELISNILHFCYNPLHIKKIPDKFLDEIVKQNETYKILMLTEVIYKRMAKLKAEGSGSLSGSVSIITSAVIQAQMAPGSNLTISGN